MENEQYYHVFLADDDRDQGLLFERVLKQVDPNIELAIENNGSDLLDHLEKEIPDLLFLDLKMPRKNGYECLSEIRNHLKLSDLPIVVYSSSSHMSDIAKAYEHHADLYMVKPFNSQHLRNALHSILKMEWRINYPNQKFYFINNKFVPFTAYEDLNV
ncbi:MAG: response regulator [Candidatus Dadabacteria bacterium]